MKRKRSSFDTCRNKEICARLSSDETRGEVEVDETLEKVERTATSASELALNHSDEEASDTDSLFDTNSEEIIFDTPEISNSETMVIAQLGAPSIPGLFFDPTILIPNQLAQDVWTKAMEIYFSDKNVNQIMLFQRSKNALTNEVADNNIRSTPPSGFPRFLIDLLNAVQVLLKGKIPAAVYDILFPSEDSDQARQIILNHYLPGEGITAHVDLLKRYGDGIIGVSFNSGCSMQFENTLATLRDQQQPRSRFETKQSDTRSVYSVYLPPRSIIVLSGESRFIWTHGIDRVKEDIIETSDGVRSNLARGERLSVTYRWLLAGADVVGS